MIGIVGGGLAGLAAAYRLQQAGYDVHIFEATDDIGGLAASYDTAGDPIEQYYHHLSKSEETIVKLATELGLGNKIEWRIGKNAYYVDGICHPLDTPWEILAYPHLSMYDKLRLGLLTLGWDMTEFPARKGTFDNIEDYESISVKEFILTQTTENVYEYFFKPLLRAKFGNRHSDISAAWLLGRIKFRGHRDFLRGEVLGYITGGFHQLLSALIHAIGREHITTESKVVDLTISNNSVSHISVENNNSVTTHDVDAVIVATMPDVLEDLTGYACSIDFQGSICALVSLSDPLLDTYWLNIADDAPFGALIEHTNFIPQTRYGGEHLVYIASYIQSVHDSLWHRSDNEITNLWIDGLQDLFPTFDPNTINWINVARNPKTAPVYEQGYLQQVIPYDLSEQIASGLYYAGMATKAQYPERSLNGAIKAGEATARTVRRNFDP